MIFANKLVPVLLKVRPTHQHGLTLVELLVAMAISLLVTLAAIAALMVSRQGFTAVDASSQLRDNGRFAADLLQRLGGQTGYLNAQYVMETARLYGDPIKVKNKKADPDSNISGANNSSWKKNADDDHESGTFIAHPTGVGGNSDVLVFRFQPSIDFTDGAGKTFSGMINCAGNSVDEQGGDSNHRGISVFYVGPDTNNPEPALRCATGYAKNMDAAQPLIHGVETFQVLYGVDRVSPNAVTVADTPAEIVAGTGQDDAVPDRYLRADQMEVSGNEAATKENWRRVRSIRIGMVLRGPVGSATDNSAQTFYPFGKAKSSSTGAEGGALASTSDLGTIFKPTPDGRLRQTMTFTIHLRNNQKYGL